MAFPDGFLDEVRRSADIVRFISDHVPLKKMGASWKGLCPFHEEKTPSFNVRQEPPLFHCFGCGEGGDVFKFVMLRERASFPEAVEIVARRFGVAVPERSFEPGPERKEKEELLAVMEAAAEHFARNFWTAPGARAREYLLGRGFKRETLERIRAGASADSWSDLLDGLKRSFAPGLLQKAGLVLERQGKEGHYDRFRNRAVFPIVNESGKVVAFGARSLDGSEPKYLNSPETPVYQKGRTLYGLHWAKDSIRREGRVVLMEGYLDVARAIEGGVAECVATCGTALTQGHARLLRRFSERAVVNFDQDAAGQRAAERSLDLLAAEGVEVRVVELPAGDDPDTFIKARGGEAFRERVAAARPWMEWLIHKAAAENDTKTPPGKAAFLAALLPSLARVASAVERSAWLQAAVERGRLDPQAARLELKKALGGAKGVALPAPAATPPSERRAMLLPAEKWLLALLFREATGVAEALDELEDGDLDALPSSEILKAAKALLARGERLSAARLQEAVTGEAARMVTELAVADAPTGDATPLACVVEIKCRPLEARIDQIGQELKRTADDAEQSALLQEQIALKRRVQDLLRSRAVSLR
ncbi:MAG TPA: DNA primase [Vicinamibacteria bacterium]|nr:DNA primase [Vicinamibacteria bacterium]